MLTKKEIIDIATNQLSRQVYVVHFRPGEHDWIPVREGMTYIHRNHHPKTGQICMIQGFDVRDYSEDGIAMIDNSMMILFNDKADYEQWQQDKEAKSNELAKALRASIEANLGMPVEFAEE